MRMKSILNLVFVLAFGVFGHIRAQDSLPSGVVGNRPAFYNSRQDKLFPVGDVKDAYAEMRKVWHSRQADDRLVTKLWEEKHFFSRKMQREVLEFFGEWLAKTATTAPEGCD